MDASFTLGLRPHLAIKADLGYAWAPHVLGTPSRSDVLSYMIGPVFYLTPQRHFGTYIQALGGGAKVTGPVTYQGTIYIGGWSTGYAWALGGGTDYRLTDSLAIRTGVDYLRTTYYGPTLKFQGQHKPVEAEEERTSKEIARVVGGPPMVDSREGNNNGQD